MSARIFIFSLITLALTVSGCSYPEPAATVISVPSSQPEWAMEGADSAKTSAVTAQAPGKWDTHSHMDRLRPYRRGYSWVETASPLVISGVMLLGTSSRELVAVEWKGGRVVWKVAMGGKIFAAPAYGDSRIIVADDLGEVKALGMDGAELWSFESGDYPIYASPVIKDGQVFILTADQNLFCLNLEDGVPVWQYSKGLRSDGAIWRGTSVAVDETRAYLGLTDGWVVALDSEVGRVLWQRQVSDKKLFPDVAAGPVVSGGVVYVGTRDNIAALDSALGEMIWTRPFGAVGGLAVMGDNLIFGTTGGAVGAMKRIGAELAWTTQLDGGAPTGPVVAGDRIVVGASQGSLFSLDGATGKILEQYNPASGISGRPWVGEEGVAVITNAGVLHRFVHGD